MYISTIDICVRVCVLPLFESVCRIAILLASLTPAALLSAHVGLCMVEVDGCLVSMCRPVCVCVYVVRARDMTTTDRRRRWLPWMLPLFLSLFPTIITLYLHHAKIQPHTVVNAPYKHANYASSIFT